MSDDDLDGIIRRLDAALGVPRARDSVRDSISRLERLLLAQRCEIHAMREELKQVRHRLKWGQHG